MSTCYLRHLYVFLLNFMRCSGALTAWHLRAWHLACLLGLRCVQGYIPTIFDKLGDVTTVSRRLLCLWLIGFGVIGLGFCKHCSGFASPIVLWGLTAWHLQALLHTCLLGSKWVSRCVLKTYIIWDECRRSLTQASGSLADWVWCYWYGVLQHIAAASQACLRLCVTCPSHKRQLAFIHATLSAS